MRRVSVPRLRDERSFLDDASLSSTANDEAYIAGVALTGDEENKLEQIITQKWLALYPSGVGGLGRVPPHGFIPS